MTLAELFVWSQGGGTPPAPTTPTAPVQGQSCSAVYSIDTTWTQNDVAFAVFNLYLQNTGTAAVPAGYTVDILDPGYSTLAATWNWQVTTALHQIKGFQ